MYQLGDDDPRDKWKKLKRLIGKNKRHRIDALHDINTDNIEFGSEKAYKAMFNFQKNLAGTLAADNPPREFLEPQPIEDKLCDPVTIEEIEESLKKLKTGKAPSPITGITTEMLKFGGTHLATLMKKIIDLCITDSEICLVWRKGEVIFLYKKRRYNTVWQL